MEEISDRSQLLNERVTSLFPAQRLHHVCNSAVMWNSSKRNQPSHHQSPSPTYRKTKELHCSLIVMNAARQTYPPSFCFLGSFASTANKAWAGSPCSLWCLQCQGWAPSTASPVLPTVGTKPTCALGARPGWHTSLLTSKVQSKAWEVGGHFISFHPQAWQSLPNSFYCRA